MKEVLDFLNKAEVYYLATVEGDQPRVRPIGFVMEWEGKPAFVTGNKKNMYKQLIANPKVEICAYDGKGNTLRLCGRVVFVTSAENQRKALEMLPVLANRYSVGDGVFEVFCLEAAKAVCADMNGVAKELPL
ncbi:MAG: pyridoxamine 5'-phosphate oxidase family protein [Gracilibacteraceae bacterium]|jgi:uncharacterized pyridoxamine 5'-phosphate oxidase family protein|nr:pyridoxamine 5'-phosphate oxidase family protein [Gracilibacteraceae bacterium]